MTKSRALILGLCLILLSLFSFPLYPLNAAGLSATQGTVGTAITVSGMTAGEYVIYWDNTGLQSGTVPSGGSVNFTVPESVGGSSHTVRVENPSGTVTYPSQAFTVLPSISISPETGPVGTTVTVTGKGFLASEASIKITYAAVDIKSGISAGTTGSWSSTFDVPASKSGANAVDASGATTTAASVGDKNFTVTPAISVTPTSCGVGCTITVKGSGFTASETGIKVMFGTAEMRTAIAADSAGSWTTTFDVPSTHSGAYIIDALGNTTLATAVADVSFSVVSGISIDKTSVYVGDIVAVTGTGFAANENNIFVTFSGVKQGDAVTADANGLWHSTFTVPETVNGSHVVDAYGGITTAGGITDKNLAVMCKVSLSPLAGNVGDTISVKGSGFSGSRTITVQFGTIQVISELSTGENGSFLTTFKVPRTAGGNIEVVVKDAANISSGAMFELDKIPPSVPRIKSPISNKTMGIIGDTRVDFFWNEVSDPSGVTYDIQVATDIDFNGIVMEKTELSAAEYRSFDDEKLPQGPYYWRVRAMDYASNVSAWSTPAQFKVGLVSLTTLLIIVAVLVVVILIAARASAVFKSKKN